MKDAYLGLPILKFAVKREPDIVTARQKTRLLADLIGFDNQDQVRLATAISELARNVFQYAGEGTIDFYFAEGPVQTLFVKVLDSGPGIPWLADILDGTYQSKSGMGVGLTGTRKITDFFEIESTPGKGTKVIIGKHLDRRAKKLTGKDILAIVDQLANRKAENPFEEVQSQNRDLLCLLDEVKRTQDELAELNRELTETNRGVVALYGELDEKAASLQNANEVKTKFLSHMTHEYRTPLSSIVSLTRLLLDRVDGELSSEQERQVNYIRSSAEGLLELVNDLLDLAKVEAGKVAINAAPFEGNELLSGLRGVFRPILNGLTNIDLVVDSLEQEIQFHSDQPKIAQILRNLISNAIKFAESGAIRVTTALGADDLVTFVIEDQGVGIAPEFLEVIFEDYSQIGRQSPQFQKGTGLGLPLSRKLARLLGGDLVVDSTVGQGSRFTVTVPRVYQGASEGLLFDQGAEAYLKETRTRSESVSADFSILLIDDDPLSRGIVKDLLRTEIDASFVEMTDGKQGLKFLQTHIPDLIVLDLSMPEMDGVEFLSMIRRKPETRSIPVIINTSKRLSEFETDFLKRSCSAILSKEEKLDAHKMAFRNALEAAGFDYKVRSV